MDEIKVGDRVRLKGWQGAYCGLTIWADTKEMVGTEAEVEELDPDDNTAWIRNEARAAWWPVSMLEPIDAPRPSAWTKTSEGKPDQDKVVVGFWVQSMRMVKRCTWDGARWTVDGWGVPPPDFWIDEPEVP